MRLLRSSVLAFATAVALLPAAVAAEDQCPLPLHECLEQYTQMRARPWMGVVVETDSTTGERRIESVTPGEPADRAGVKPGDVLESINGLAPKDWFAGKAGWKPGDKAQLAVKRDGQLLKLDWTLSPIGDERLANLMGAHILGGHLAHGDYGQGQDGPHRH